MSDLEITPYDTTPDIGRCRTCGRLLTRLEVNAIFEGTKEPPLCPCGGNSFSSSWPVGPEWLLPRVLKLVILRALGKA